MSAPAKKVKDTEWIPEEIIKVGSLAGDQVWFAI